MIYLEVGFDLKYQSITHLFGGEKSQKWNIFDDHMSVGTWECAYNLYE